MSGGVDFEIRRIESDDMLKLGKLHRQSWLDTYTNADLGISQAWLETFTAQWGTEEGLEDYQEEFMNDLTQDTFLGRVAVVKGSIGGLLYATKLPDESYHLQALHVAKVYHDKGLGPQLFQAFEEWAEPTQPVKIEVVRYNGPAIRFYEKRGFRIAPGSEYTAYERIPCFWMIRHASEVHDGEAASGIPALEQ